MEKTKECFELNEEESESVSRLTVHQHRDVACTFKVPRRLTDRNGNLANGAIANLVDDVGASVVHIEGLPMKDELEITARPLRLKGGYSGTIILLRNKATGEIIAEGRHSLFGKHASKM